MSDGDWNLGVVTQCSCGAEFVVGQTCPCHAAPEKPSICPSCTNDGCPGDEGLAIHGCNAFKPDLEAEIEKARAEVEWLRTAARELVNDWLRKAAALGRWESSANTAMRYGFSACARDLQALIDQR